MSSHYETDYFSGDKPVHRTSYCAFLDILGFSERIKESFTSGRGNELLQEFHSIFSKQIDRMTDEAEDSLLYFKSFTDNIVLAHPRFSPDLESEFGFTFWALSEYQYEMALKGFFIRGGLSIGDLFINENNISGPALLESYALESRTAVNPCVVLSDDVMGLVSNHLKFYSGEVAPQNRAVLVNPDGRFFINYLSESIYDTGSSEEVDWESLNTHRERIEQALQENVNIKKVFDKFVWLSAYHNFFCRSVSFYPGYDKSVLVARKHSSIRIRTLAQVLAK